MEEDQRWTWTDVLWGGVFLLVGVLVSTVSFLAMRNGMPVALFGMGLVFGPTLAVLGVNAIWRGARSAHQD